MIVETLILTKEISEQKSKRLCSIVTDRRSKNIRNRSEGEKQEKLESIIYVWFSVNLRINPYEVKSKGNWIRRKARWKSDLSEMGKIYFYIENGGMEGIGNFAVGKNKFGTYTFQIFLSISFFWDRLWVILFDFNKCLDNNTKLLILVLLIMVCARLSSHSCG
jgi:hypothetical protein